MFRNCFAQFPPTTFFWACPRHQVAAVTLSLSKGGVGLLQAALRYGTLCWLLGQPPFASLTHSHVSSRGTKEPACEMLLAFGFSPIVEMTAWGVVTVINHIHQIAESSNCQIVKLTNCLLPLYPIAARGFLFVVDIEAVVLLAVAQLNGIAGNTLIGGNSNRAWASRVGGEHRKIKA